MASFDGAHEMPHRPLVAEAKTRRGAAWLPRSPLARFLIGFPLILTGVVGITLALLMTCYPKVDAPGERKAPSDPATVERGKHLVENVAACTTCHSERDWATYGAPPKPEGHAAGGPGYDRAVGLPGVFPAPNLTPSALSDWSDAEIGHVLQTGVSKRVGSLMPVMPYLSYAGLCSDDVDAIIAYLRTLEAKQAELAERELDFPLPLLIRTFPSQGDAPPCPGDTDPEELHGAYLARAAGCANCHTATRDGRPLLDMGFAGGSEFKLPTRDLVAASNLTMDESTGIGSWTREQFIKAFRTRSEPRALGPGERATNMPWLAYALMSDEELGAIYAYLKTIPEVPNLVKQPRQKAAKQKVAN